jgi:hypothetical protein
VNINAFLPTSRRRGSLARSQRLERLTPTRSRRASRGQSLVEFALIVPLLITLFAGAADLGRALTAYIELGSAAREGAAYGSQSDTFAREGDGAAMEAAAKAAAPDIWGTEPVVNATYCSIIDNACDGDDYGYSFVTVSASYTFTPILGEFLDIGPITMTRERQMRVIN